MRSLILLSSFVLVARVLASEPTPSVDAMVIRIPIGKAIPFEDAVSARVWPEDLCSTAPGEKGLLVTCTKVGKGSLEITRSNGRLSRDMLDVVGPATVVAPVDITPTPGETIALTPRQTARRSFEGLTRVAVGDPNIATASVGEHGEVSFTGKSAGDTSAVLWMTGGKLLAVRLHVSSK